MIDTELHIGKRGVIKDDKGFPSTGQKLIDRADRVLKETPFKGVRCRSIKDDPDTKPGKVQVIVPSTKK